MLHSYSSSFESPQRWELPAAPGHERESLRGSFAAAKCFILYKFLRLTDAVGEMKSEQYVVLSTLLITVVCEVVSSTVVEHKGNGDLSNGDISLWIDEKQVKDLSGFPMRIYAIVDGAVLPYVLDPNFEKYLPIIPSEVTSVNFTWKSGELKQYSYNFDQLMSYNEDILANPFISIDTKGHVPNKPRTFEVFLPCVGNVSGIASLAIGLAIFNSEKKYLPGTPLRLRLQKQCSQRTPDPECDERCANGGWCNKNKICECPKGYIGKYCESALCYPVCMNGGVCMSPGVCTCTDNFQGPHCEGGICREKCLNGGKCIQKDTCKCRRGYYGPRCEFSKCMIPCLNGGRCVGVNRCRCRRGFRGSQCERPPGEFPKKNRSRKRQRKKFV